MYTRVLLACPLLGGLSSFGVSLSEVSLHYAGPYYLFYAPVSADLSGCQGLRTVQNSDEANLACAHFTWGHTDTATVALKVNCLSTEFAIRKHGKGSPYENT